MTERHFSHIIAVDQVARSICEKGNKRSTLNLTLESAWDLGQLVLLSTIWHIVSVDVGAFILHRVVQVEKGVSKEFAFITKGCLGKIQKPVP